MYIIINTDSIFELVHALNNLKYDLFVSCLIMLPYASLVERSNTKLNIGSGKCVTFGAEHFHESDHEACSEHCCESCFF